MNLYKYYQILNVFCAILMFLAIIFLPIGPMSILIVVTFLVVITQLSMIEERMKDDDNVTITKTVVMEDDDMFKKKIKKEPHVWFDRFGQVHDDSERQGMYKEEGF